jgi:TM2 domain-containing membrane protein YozV
MKTWVLIAVAAVLSVTTTVGVVGACFFSGGLGFVAEKLTEKPDVYIPLTEPDHYVLQAVSNPRELVVVGASRNSEFDEMVQTYGTDNVEIDGKYYRIQIYFIEAIGWGTLFLLSLVGWFVFGVAVLIKGLVCLRNRARS